MGNLIFKTKSAEAPKTPKKLKEPKEPTPKEGHDGHPDLAFLDEIDAYSASTKDGNVVLSYSVDAIQKLRSTIRTAYQDIGKRFESEKFKAGSTFYQFLVDVKDASNSTLPALEPGGQVLLSGLSKVELNGKK